VMSPEGPPGGTATGAAAAPTSSSGPAAPSATAPGTPDHARIDQHARRDADPELLDEDDLRLRERIDRDVG
jgi:hypothetical protein